MRHSHPVATDKVDLDSPEHIERFITLFYARLLADEQLAPIFIDVAKINLPQHMLFIQSYWEKLLLNKTGYQRHTMNIHRRIHRQRHFQDADFQRWFELFCQTLEANFAGENTRRARRIAERIISNMRNAFKQNAALPATQQPD